MRGKDTSSKLPKIWKFLSEIFSEARIIPKLNNANINGTVSQIKLPQTIRVLTPKISRFMVLI